MTESFLLQLKVTTFFPPRPQFISQYSQFASWVLLAPESGRFWFRVGDDLSTEEGEARFGDLVFAAPHAVFDRRALEPISYHVLLFSWEGSASEGSASNSFSLRPGRRSVRDTARLTSTLGLLRTLQITSDERARARRHNLLEDLLHLGWEAEAELRLPTDPLMREAAHRLRERAGDALSIRAIALEFGLSPAQFSRRFQSAHGITPSEFLTARRLEIARELLLETDLSVEHIAQKCGYSTGFYLSHVFGRHFGLAPGRFRRQHRV